MSLVTDCTAAIIESLYVTDVGRRRKNKEWVQSIGFISLQEKNFCQSFIMEIQSIPPFSENLFFFRRTASGVVNPFKKQ